MRRSTRGYGDDGDDTDSGYLNFTYRPLSRLPTPPPTLSHDASMDGELDDGELLRPQHRGPAIHLVNLIPSSASLANASVPLVQAMLARAALPIETVALAVCILDSLDAKFGRSWRLACPPTPTPANKRHTLPSLPSANSSPPHIDSVRPEVIVLAALAIAAKFTLDEPPPPARVSWGRSLWSAQQLSATERCIMLGLDWRILPLCDDDCLADAMVDMQLAGRLDESRWAVAGMKMPREPTPPDSLEGSECDYDGGP